MDKSLHINNHLNTWNLATLFKTIHFLFEGCQVLLYYIGSTAFTSTAFTHLCFYKFSLFIFVCSTWAYIAPQWPYECLEKTVNYVLISMNQYISSHLSVNDIEIFLLRFHHSICGRGFWWFLCCRNIDMSWFQFIHQFVLWQQERSESNKKMEYSYKYFKLLLFCFFWFAVSQLCRFHSLPQYHLKKLAF